MNSLLSSIQEIDSSYRLDQYKNRNSAVLQQEERRKKFFESIKDRRFNFKLHARCLAEGKWPQDFETEESMDCDVFPVKPSYQDQLMLSEWMLEIPPDIEEEWIWTLCPQGVRCLVIASKGTTKSYHRSGNVLNKFSSLLPGGSKWNKSNTYTILDCVYSKKSKTFYILDVMCWNGLPVYDSETDFRFYWLKEKYSEEKDLDQASSRNPLKFVLLPTYSCSQQNISKVMNEPLPFSVELDGLLFHHKKNHYTPGKTPLVAWLKPYMLSEVFGIEIPDELNSDKPEDYESMRISLKKHYQRKEQMDVN